MCKKRFFKKEGKEIVLKKKKRRKQAPLKPYSHSLPSGLQPTRLCCGQQEGELSLEAPETDFSRCPLSSEMSWGKWTWEEIKESNEVGRGEEIRRGRWLECRVSGPRTRKERTNGKDVEDYSPAPWPPGQREWLRRGCRLTSLQSTTLCFLHARQTASL